MRRFPPKLFLQRHFRNSFYQQGLFWPIIGFSWVQPNLQYQPVAIGRGGLSVGLGNPFLFFKNVVPLKIWRGGPIFHRIGENAPTEANIPKGAPR